MDNLEQIALRVAEETDMLHGRQRDEWPIEFTQRLVTALGAQEPVAALDLAIVFHRTYEQLAPNLGYDTRKATRIFDPESVNGRLMIATCAEVIRKFNLAAQQLPQREGWQWVPKEPT